MNLTSILLFSLLLTGTSFSQDYMTEELMIPFEYHPESNRWQIVDENYSLDNILGGRLDQLPVLPSSGITTDFYHSGFFHVGDRFIEFSQYPGTRFFFQEWSDSLRSDLLHYGEVEIDIESVDMREVTLTSMDGEDSLGLDLFYTFKKVGPWEFRLPDNTKLFGNYEQGTRVGVWTSYRNEVYIPGFFPVVATYDYDNGELKSSNLVDKSGAGQEEKLKLLNGKWKSYTWDAKTVAMCRQGISCIYKFEKLEKEKFPCSDHFMGTIGCGTAANKNPLKWQVNQDNTITIEGSKFAILYLTNEYLMLKLE